MLDSGRPRSERAAITACIAALCEAFGKTPSEATFGAYDLGLAGLPVNRIQAATASALQENRKFMPTPGELRALASCEVSAADKAIHAWPCVERAIALHGTYRHPTFDDPIINAAIRSMGGWVALCSREQAEFDKWARKEFCEAYESFSRSGVNGDLCRPLTGLNDSTEVQEVATGLPWAQEHQQKLPAPRTDDDDRPRLTLMRP